jgi:WD40 repeat protein
MEIDSEQQNEPIKRNLSSILTGSLDGTVKLWDVSMKDFVPNLELVFTSEKQNVGVSSIASLKVLA